MKATKRHKLSLTLSVFVALVRHVWANEQTAPRSVPHNNTTARSTEPERIEHPLQAGRGRTAGPFVSEFPYFAEDLIIRLSGALLHERSNLRMERVDLRVGIQPRIDQRRFIKRAHEDVATALDRARAEAERWHGPLLKTPFLVTDNGPSFIARRFQGHIKGKFAHVRIQYRTPTQLGLLERFHQTLKNEEVYWRLYQSPAEAGESLEIFRRRYNDVRPHWALVPQGGGDVLTPMDVYVHGQAVELPRWQGWAKAAKEKLQQLVQGARLPEATPPALEAAA